MSSSVSRYGWCSEHQATIGPDGRCEWDVRVEQHLDGPRGPLPRQMSADQIAVARAALVRDREWYERQVWRHMLQLAQIRKEIAELDARFREVA